MRTAQLAWPRSQVPLNVPILQLTGTPTLGLATPRLTYLGKQGDSQVWGVVTSDSDGFTTTSVQIHQVGLGLVGTCTNDGAGIWHLDDICPAPGEYDFFARRVTAAGSVDSDTWSLHSVFNPDQNFGARCLHWRYAAAANMTQTGDAVDVWADLAPVPHNALGAATARPNFYPPGHVSQSNPMPNLGYVHYDGVNDVMTVTGLNLPAPATTPTTRYSTMRTWAWITLHRYFGALSAANIMIGYMTTSKPQISLFNGLGPAASNGFLPADPHPEWGLVRCVFTGSTVANTDKVRSINSEQIGNAGNNSGTGRREGSDGTASRFAAIDVFETVYVQGLVTTLEDQRHQDWTNYQCPPMVATPDGIWIVDGDSLSTVPYAYGASNYPVQIDNHPKLLRNYYVATGGDTSAQVITLWNSRVLPFRNLGLNPAVPNIYSLMIATNDLVLGVQASAIIANLKTIGALAALAGLTFIYIGPPSGNYSTTGGATSPASQYAALYTAITTPGPDHWSNFAADFVPTRGLVPGTFGDGVYWNLLPDGNFHPTELGQTYFDAPVRAAVLRQLPP